MIDVNKPYSFVDLRLELLKDKLNTNPNIAALRTKELKHITHITNKTSKPSIEYIEKRLVEEYASILEMSSDYLFSDNKSYSSLSGTEKQTVDTQVLAMLNYLTYIELVMVMLDMFIDKVKKSKLGQVLTFHDDSTECGYKMHSGSDLRPITFEIGLVWFENNFKYKGHSFETYYINWVLAPLAITITNENSVNHWSKVTVQQQLEKDLQNNIFIKIDTNNELAMDSTDFPGLTVNSLAKGYKELERMTLHSLDTFVK